MYNLRSIDERHVWTDLFEITHQHNHLRNRFEELMKTIYKMSTSSLRELMKTV